jgi:hypothetical protein
MTTPTKRLALLALTLLAGCTGGTTQVPGYEAKDHAVRAALRADRPQPAMRPELLTRQTRRR